MRVMECDTDSAGEHGVATAVDAGLGAVELTRALVAEPSVNPRLEAGGAGEAAVAALAGSWLRAWGFDIERLEAEPGRPSLVARYRRGAGRRLVLNGHLDTVGVAGMSVPPFAAEVRDGRLYGRGACDMKAGVAALLVAARDAVRDAAFRGELVVALVADEEHASIGMQAVLAAGLAADAAIVCEPTGLAIMPANKGFAWIRVEFRGRAAHGSRPDRGVDAIRHAGRFLARLDEIEAELQSRSPHPLLGHASLHAGTIEGGSAPSVYPDACRVVLERRTLPGEPTDAPIAEVAALLDRIREGVPELDAVLGVELDRPAAEVPADAPIVGALAGALRAAGREPAVRGMTAWVDGALLNAAGIPAVCFGPGRIEDAHSADESVAVADIEAAHGILVHSILDFLR